MGWLLRLNIWCCIYGDCSVPWESCVRTLLARRKACPHTDKFHLAQLTCHCSFLVCECESRVCCGQWEGGWLSDAGLRRWEQLSAWELCSDSSTKAAVAVHASAHVWHAKAGPENGVSELRHLQTTWDTCWRGEAQKPYTNYGTLALLSFLSSICWCRRKSIWQMGSICDGT